MHLTVAVLDGGRLERNPSQRPLRPTGDAPAQLGLLELAAARAVFLRDGLHGLRMQAQALFGCAFGVLRHVVGRHEFTRSAEHLQGQVLGVVPHHVDLPALRQKVRSVLVLDPQAQHLRHHAKGCLTLGRLGESILDRLHATDYI